jgi:putative RecB family exonuclease
MTASQTPPVKKTATPALSPSRANDFMQCPLLFRYRVVDRLREPPSAAAKKGTLVHAVLEHLYDLPRGQRTREAALALVPSEWAAMLEADPTLADLFAPGGDAAGVTTDQWVDAASALVSAYFSVEDPNLLEPAERETWVSTQLDGDGPLLRGIVDRLDIAPDGRIRVVDYKSGKSPRPGYEDKVAFQMRFYALAIWRERGVIPAMLQLIFLADGQVLRNEPTAADLDRTETQVRALWASIVEAARTGQFQPKRSKLCNWCSFQAHCPLMGGEATACDTHLAAERLGLSANG